MVGSSGSESILVVEDEAEVRAYLVETLRDLNYRVRKRLTAPRRWRCRFRAIPRRPVIDRYRDARNERPPARGEMHDRLSSLKVLFITGYSGNAVVHQGRLDSGVALLQKPLTQAMLATKISDILDRHWAAKIRLPRNGRRIGAGHALTR